MQTRTFMLVVLCTFFVVCVAQQAGTGELRGWGNDGSYLVLTNLPSGSDFIAIAAGDEQGVALKSDGSVVAWGHDYHGQATVPATLGTCIAVGAGEDTSYAIKTDGTIVGWGNDYYDLVSDIPAGTYTSVDCGEYFAVALATDGSIVAWGYDNYGQITNVPSGTDFVQVVAGDGHGVALRSNGSLASWGYVSAITGQPGTGTYTAVSAGHNFCLALKSDGSIVHWGDDPWSNGLDEVPPGNDFVEISAGYIHALARKADGTVVSWGNNDYGQAAMQMETDFQAISGGQYWSLAMAGSPDVVFAGPFETGDFSGWSAVVGASP